MGVSVKPHGMCVKLFNRLFLPKMSQRRLNRLRIRRWTHPVPKKSAHESKEKEKEMENATMTARTAQDRILQSLLQGESLGHMYRFV